MKKLRKIIFMGMSLGLILVNSGCMVTMWTDTAKEIPYYNPFQEVNRKKQEVVLTLDDEINDSKFIKLKNINCKKGSDFIEISVDYDIYVKEKISKETWEEFSSFKYSLSNDLGELLIIGPLATAFYPFTILSVCLGDSSPVILAHPIAILPGIGYKGKKGTATWRMENKETPHKTNITIQNKQVQFDPFYDFNVKIFDSSDNLLITKTINSKDKIMIKLTNIENCKLNPKNELILKLELGSGSKLIKKKYYESLTFSVVNMVQHKKTSLIQKLEDIKKYNNKFILLKERKAILTKFDLVSTNIKLLYDSTSNLLNLKDISSKYKLLIAEINSIDKEIDKVEIIYNDIEKEKKILYVDIVECKKIFESMENKDITFSKNLKEIENFKNKQYIKLENVKLDRKIVQSLTENIKKTIIMYENIVKEKKGLCGDIVECKSVFKSIENKSFKFSKNDFDEFSKKLKEFELWKNKQYFKLENVKSDRKIVQSLTDKMNKIISDLENYKKDVKTSNELLTSHIKKLKDLLISAREKNIDFFSPNYYLALIAHEKNFDKYINKNNSLEQIKSHIKMFSDVNKGVNSLIESTIKTEELCIENFFSTRNRR